MATTPTPGELEETPPTARSAQSALSGTQWALVSLVPLALVGGLGTAALNVGGSGGSAPAGLWDDQLCMTMADLPNAPASADAAPQCFDIRPKPGDGKRVLSASLPAKAFGIDARGWEEYRYWSAGAIFTLELQRQDLLNDDHRWIRIRYRLSDRRGWVNARIMATVLGACRPVARRSSAPGAPADGRPECGRWFDVPGARDGLGALVVAVPEARLRANGKLSLAVLLEVRTRLEGAVQFEVDQIEIVQ